MLIVPARIPADHLLAALHARKRVEGFGHYVAALSPCNGEPTAPARRIRIEQRSVRSSMYLVWLVEL